MPKVPFYKKDTLPVYFVAVILSVLSFVQIQGLHKVDESVHKADILAQCFTPGTRCYELSAKNQIQQTKERSANSHCLLLWGSKAVKEDITVEELFNGFDSCVTEQLKN